MSKPSFASHCWDKWNAFIASYVKKNPKYKVSFLGVESLMPFQAWLFPASKNGPYLYNLRLNNKLSSKLEILQWNSLHVLNKCSTHVFIKSTLFFTKKKQMFWHFCHSYSKSLFLWNPWSVGKTMESPQSATIPRILTLPKYHQMLENRDNRKTTATPIA